MANDGAGPLLWLQMWQDIKIINKLVKDGISVLQCHGYASKIPN